MELIAQVELPTLVALGAVALIIAVLLFRTQSYYGRSRSAPTPSDAARGEEAADAGHHPRAPAAMARWEVEMHDTARELSGRLDSKMGALEHLIREADRAAARLEAALAAARGAAGAASSPPARPAPEAQQTDPTHQPASQAEALRAVSAADSAQGRRAGDPLSTPPSSGPRPFDEIYTLADYGLAAAEIAQRVGTPVGEVELILKLRAER